MENKNEVKPFQMTHQEAMDLQFQRKTIYCVELVKTTGEKILLGSTSQKSIEGIRSMLTKNLKAQARITQAGVSLDQNYKSKKGTMILDDGNVIRFGETLRSQFHGQ